MGQIVLLGQEKWGSRKKCILATVQYFTVLGYMRVLVNPEERGGTKEMNVN